MQMNLYRWVKGLGLEPARDRQRQGPPGPVPQPDDAEGLCRAVGTDPASMVTSFADGSKISFEQAIVANATGFTVLQRGMSRGLEYRGDVMEIGALYDVDTAARARRDRRLRRRDAADEGLLPRRARRPEAAALPRALQARRRGRSTRSSSRTTSSTSRCRSRSRGSRSSATRSRSRSQGPVVEVCAVAKRDLEAGETLDTTACT